MLWCLKDVMTLPESLAKCTWKQVSSFLHAKHNKTQIKNPPSDQPSSLAWSPPPTGWIKLNTDGVSKGNPGVAGGGGLDLFRDSTGKLLKAFTFKCCISSATMAELHAVFHGLNTARQMGIDKLIIETDSLIASNIMKNGSKEEPSHHNLAEQCHHMMTASDWQTQVHKINRRTNTAADIVANWAIESTCNFSEFLSLPVAIRERINSAPNSGIPI